MNIGERIKKRRLELGLTLEDVSSKLGIAKTTVRAWEISQTRKISASSLTKLAEILKVKPTYFIYEEDHEFLNELTDIDMELIKLIIKMPLKEKLDLYSSLSTKVSNNEK